MKKENSTIQSTKITTEYIMSYEAPLDPPLAIDEGMMIVNVREGGWVTGPKINGKFIAPGADWLRIMTSSEKYNSLHEIQTINKMVEIQFGDKGFVKYDVFLVK